VCIIDPKNAPSLRVSAKLGFRAFGETDYKGKRVIKLERLARQSA
jgi:RimJ/RimL family protein N-acetyltransferase